MNLKEAKQELIKRGYKLIKEYNVAEKPREDCGVSVSGSNNIYDEDGNEI